jgi:GAF domain-containing protein
MSSRAVAHIDGDALARSLADLDRPDGDGVDVRHGIERVIVGAASVFAGSGVGLMLIADDGLTLRYVASSDEVARRLELAHERAGEGPCVDAFVQDGTVRTDDLAREARWPGLRAQLEDEPIRSILGLPTRIGTPVGTLNVYCERPRVWDAGEIAALEAYNAILEARLGGALIARAHGEIVDQLQIALDSRVVIERAIGLLMGRDGLDNMAAFQQLRANARSSRRRVVTVAEELLAAHPQGAVDGDGAQAVPDGYSSSG